MGVVDGAANAQELLVEIIHVALLKVPSVVTLAQLFYPLSD
jgi:hypothetical protein